MIWPRLAPCSRPSVRHGHGECTFDVMVRVGAWSPSDRRSRFMLVAAARSYFLPRTVLTPRSAKRAEDSSMAQLATAATLLGGCSSARPPPSTCRPGSKVSDLRASAVTLAAFRSFSRACSGTGHLATLIRRNFVGKKTDPSRAEETLSGIGAKKQRTLRISYDSRRTHALFRLPATPLTATARGAARGALASGYNTGRPRAAT